MYSVATIHQSLMIKPFPVQHLRWSATARVSAPETAAALIMLCGSRPSMVHPMDGGSCSRIPENAAGILDAVGFLLRNLPIMNHDS